MLLAGALGGMGAWAASVVGRTSPVRANDPNDVVLGSGNTTTSTTVITNTSTTGGSTAFRGVTFGAGEGVWGQTNGGGTGVFGYTPGGGRGVYGVGYGNATGVVGSSSDVPGGAPPNTKTGVFGYANQDTAARGVWGHSPVGVGVYGQTSTGYAGYFRGKVFSTQFYELAEIATPGAPGANKARLFIRDNGSGKSQLCVRFATGSTKLLAAE